MTGDLGTFVANGQAAQAAADKLGSINPTALLCASKCRQFILEEAKRSRPFNKFNRVSQGTLVLLNEILKREMRSLVRRAPSKGHTL